MKKILLMIFSIIVISVNILGCQSKETLSVQPETPESEYKLLNISNINYDKKTKSISYEVKNKSDFTLFTGYPFYIEKYDDKEGWVKTNLTDNLAFIESAILIESNGTYVDKIDLTKVSIMEYGYYRIVKEYSSESEKIKVYIQLELKDGDMGDLQGDNKIN